MTDAPDEVLFQAATPLGFRVRVTRSSWALVVNVKHPVMAGREGDVKQTLERPVEIRVSRRDPTVYLFYRLERERRWTCAVVKRTEESGFLITAYPTDAIKEGDTTWPK